MIARAARTSSRTKEARPARVTGARHANPAHSDAARVRNYNADRENSNSSIKSPSLRFPERFCRVKSIEIGRPRASSTRPTWPGRRSMGGH